MVQSAEIKSERGEIELGIQKSNEIDLESNFSNPMKRDLIC